MPNAQQRLMKHGGRSGKLKFCASIYLYHNLKNICSEPPPRFIAADRYGQP